MKRKVERGFYITLKQQIVWIISTAFAIAAALFWKDTFTFFTKWKTEFRANTAAARAQSYLKTERWRADARTPMP